MPRRRSRQNDPLDDEIETALRPEQFIGSGFDDGFISDLEVVKRQIDGLIRADPERAIRLYELFLAASYQKADEVDDSDGMFGDETAALLLRRMPAFERVIRGQREPGFLDRARARWGR